MIRQYRKKKIGRDGGIRTHDPLTPSQVRYQAALHPESVGRRQSPGTFELPATRPCTLHREADQVTAISKVRLKAAPTGNQVVRAS